jgi:hypothetical protein
VEYDQILIDIDRRLMPNLIALKKQEKARNIKTLSLGVAVMAIGVFAYIGLARKKNR